MIKKTLCFSNSTYLSLRQGQMVIAVDDDDGNRRTVTRPIEDLGVVIIESHSVTITSALIANLIENNVAVVMCDKTHMPSGLILPVAAHSMTTERALAQIGCSQPLRKQLWQQTVAAKIANQAAVLAKTNPEAGDCMIVWSKSVRSGDPDNLEARAAVYYWKNLFPSTTGFKRGDEDAAVNALLNYGYAILRAVIGRALVGSGLIPMLGLFHSNKFNPYCLADDLMEPYRPYVDRLVLQIVQQYNNQTELTKDIKKELLGIPVLDVTIDGIRRPLMVAANKTTSSLAKCYMGNARKIIYPAIT